MLDGVHGAPAAERSAPAPAVFFVLVFLLSWLWWVPLMLMRLRVLPAPVPLGSLTALALPGVLVPAIVALLLTARRGGGAVRDLLATLARWRFGAAWWIAVVLQPVVLLLVTGVVIATRLGSPHAPDGMTIAALCTNAVFLLIAAVGEELGWRGVALPGLLLRLRPLTASLVLGVLVAAWHVPYWILQGVLAQYGPVYLLLDLVFVIALTYQLTWLFLRSGRSVLAAVAFHVSFNLVNVALLPVTDSITAFGVLTVVECGIAALAASRLMRRMP